MKYLILLILLTAISHLEDNRSIRDEVKNSIIKKNNDINSVSFELKIENKMLFDLDTSETIYYCEYFKLCNEKAFNGILRSCSDKGFEKYLINGNIYYVYHNKKEIRIFDDIIINEDSVKINKYFKEFSYNNINNLPKLLTILTDTSYHFSIIQETGEYCFRKDHPDEGDISNAWNEILINNEYDIYSNISNVRYKGFNQWEKANISNLLYNNVDTTVIMKRVDSLLRIYELIYSSDINQQNNKNDSTYRSVLENNSKAPAFSGFYYQDNRNINLQEFKSNIILIDFWYTSCIPCILAIPYLNQLYDKYNGKGLVILGLNKYDNTPERREVLEMYLTKQTVKYPIILTEKSKNIDSIYKVKAYPTMYLLDSNYNILHSKVGFSEESMDSLDMIIKKYLKIEE